MIRNYIQYNFNNRKTKAKSKLQLLLENISFNDTTPKNINKL